MSSILIQLTREEGGPWFTVEITEKDLTDILHTGKYLNEEIAAVKFWIPVSSSMSSNVPIIYDFILKHLDKVNPWRIV